LHWYQKTRKQNTAYFLNTEDKQKKIVTANKETEPWFDTAFATSGQEMEWALFLQPRSPHAANSVLYSNTHMHAAE